MTSVSFIEFFSMIAFTSSSEKNQLAMNPMALVSLSDITNCSCAVLDGPYTTTHISAYIPPHSITSVTIIVRNTFPIALRTLPDFLSFPSSSGSSICEPSTSNSSTSSLFLRLFSDITFLSFYFLNTHLLCI